jgi:hypothetical protein
VFGPNLGKPSPEIIATVFRGNEANARLISAAPELYDASTQTIELLDNLIEDLQRIAGASVISGLAKLKRQHIAALNKADGEVQS